MAVSAKALERRRLLQDALGKTPLMTTSQVARLWGKSSVGKLDFFEYMGMVRFRPMSVGRPAVVVRNDLQEVVNWAASSGHNRETVEGKTLKEIARAAQKQSSIKNVTGYAKSNRVLKQLQERGIVKTVKNEKVLTVEIQDPERFEEILKTYAAARRLAVKYKRSF